MTSTVPRRVEHLAALPADRWALWRSVALRSAGFPADEVLRFAFPECLAAADRLLEASERLEEDRSLLWAEILRRLDALRVDGEVRDRDQRRRLLRSLRKLGKGKVPPPLPGVLPDDLRAAVERGLALEHQEEKSYRKAYAAAVEEEGHRLSRSAHELAKVLRRALERPSAELRLIAVAGAADEPVE